MEESNLYDYIELTKKMSPITLDLVTAETDEEFDSAFDHWLTQGVAQLERNSKNFKKLDEEGLSAALAIALTTGEVSVTQEENSNGHVDLTIKLVNASKPRLKLGEAKIWKGNSYHIKGLEQLLKRYTTGRECRGFVISYVRLKDITGLFTELRKYINDHKSCDLNDLCKDHNIQWSFLSDHKHGSGKLVEVCHVGCNLFIDGA